jgi:hypothetical protein
MTSAATHQAASGMKIYYRVFGLTFKSDRELPGLDRLQETSVVDYCLRFDDCTRQLEMLCRNCYPWYVSPRHVSGERTVLQVWKTEDCRKFLFRFYDGVEFIVDRGCRTIWVNDLRRGPLEAATHHLLFSLPGFLLGLRKSACLQGAAIGLSEGAIALLGKSKSGKSVLSAAMAARGAHVLSDDLVALDVIDDAVKVYPGYPWACLRPESLHCLRAENFDADRFRSKWHYLDEAFVTWDLRQIGAPSQLKPVKLKAIYLLAPVTSRCKAAIEPIRRHQALMALMEAADQTHIPYPEFRRQEFWLMASVVAAVPTYGLRYHLSADSLADVSDILLRLPGAAAERREEVEHDAAFN